MSGDWLHKDVWHMDGQGFRVEVSRHTVPRAVEPGCYDAEGPNRWCVYAYVYPKHPMFSSFKPDKSMWEQLTPALHGGCTYFRVHRKNEDDTILSFQFGADYHHDGDWRFTQMATREDAGEVFYDAQELFNLMQERAQENGHAPD